MFEQAVEDSYVKMMNIDICAGTGGLLSHAPRRVQSMFILTDAWQIEGITRMFQDSVFMMPHLGVLSTVYRDAAWNVFDKDCLVRLGTSVVPSGTGKIGEHVMDVELEMPSDETLEEKLNFGDIKLIELTEGEEASIHIIPGKQFDIGAGPGKERTTTVSGGVAGVMLDARGRPLYLPEEESQRKDLLLKWFRSLKLYPEESLGELI
jgi:hypothetical protein